MSALDEMLSSISTVFVAVVDKPYWDLVFQNQSYTLKSAKKFQHMVDAEGVLFVESRREDMSQRRWAFIIRGNAFWKTNPSPYGPKFHHTVIEWQGSAVTIQGVSVDDVLIWLKDNWGLKGLNDKTSNGHLFLRGGRILAKP